MYELMREKPSEYANPRVQRTNKDKKNNKKYIDSEAARKKFTDMLLASTPRYLKFLAKYQPPRSLTETVCPIPEEKRNEAEDERARLEEKMIGCLKQILDGKLDSIEEFLGI